MGRLSLLAFIAVAFSHMEARQNKAAPAAGVNLDSLYAGFVGEWVGHLEYRDFGDNSRVLLPTWLEISRDPDGRSLRFAYIYDDGPNKTVKQISLVAIDAAAAAASFTSDRDRTGDHYKVEGMEEFSRTNSGKLTLTGSGTENDKKVKVRITITLRRNLYSYRKETQPPGEEFQFRDGYTFTRKQPPQ